MQPTSIYPYHKLPCLSGKVQLCEPCPSPDCRTHSELDVRSQVQLKSFACLADGSRVRPNRRGARGRLARIVLRTPARLRLCRGIGLCLRGRRAGLKAGSDKM